MARDEEELDDEMSCTRYCLTELRKKETGLLVKQDEAQHRYQVLLERLKLEGKLELEIAGLELNHEQH